MGKLTLLKTGRNPKNQAKRSGRTMMSEEAKAEIVRLLRALSPEERERFRKMLHRVLPFRQDPAAWAHAKRLITYAYRGLLRERRPTLGLRSVDEGRRK